MSLKKEMKTQGDFLFRWRSYFPLVFVVFMFAAIFADPANSMIHESRSARAPFCISVTLLGLLVRAYTAGFVPGRTSGRNTKKQIAESLNTSGIYSVVRHPLYLGNYLSGLGIAFYTGIWWMGFIYTLVFYLYYERIMFAEEEFLRGKFGQKYESWSEKTPAFIPRMTGFRKSNLSFSFRTVLRREYPGFFAAIVSFALVDLVMAIAREKAVSILPVWQYLLAGGAVLYLILRTVKKYTTFFKVSGR